MCTQLTARLLAATALAAAMDAPTEIAAQSPIDMIPGVVEATQTVDVAAPVAGVLADVSVHEMQLVKRDQLLASLDDRVARAALEAAMQVADRAALLQRAESTVALAEKFLERVRDAYEKDAASGLELDEAEGRLQEARAGLAAAYEQQREAAAQVELERAKLEAYQVRAPFSGVVSRIVGKPGGIASPHEPILSLTNLSRLRVSLHVPLEYFGRLTVGESYTLAAESPAPARVRAALVAQLPVIDAATNTFRCVLEIDNSDLSLPAGFAVRLCEPVASDSPSNK